MEAKAYPSDLSDEQWELLKDFVAQGKMGRPRTVNIREVISAILYVVTQVPVESPSWGFSSLENSLHLFSALA